MIEYMQAAYTAILSALGLSGDAVVVLMLASLMSIMLTQWGKFWIRAELPDDVRHRITQGIAFMSAAIPALIGLIYICQPLATMWAMVCGLWTPTAWRLGMVMIGWRWPDVRAALSQDVRE